MCSPRMFYYELGQKKEEAIQRPRQVGAGRPSACIVRTSFRALPELRDRQRVMQVDLTVSCIDFFEMFYLCCIVCIGPLDIIYNRRIKK
jgi:hypothetical protein